MKLKNVLLGFVVSLFCTVASADMTIPKGFVEMKKHVNSDSPVDKIQSDLDGDGVKDTVMYAIEDKKGEDYEKYRLLLVYLSDTDKTEILSSDFFDEYLLGSVLDLNKNVISVSALSGGTGMYEADLKFRYNPEQQSMQLIGFDYSYRGVAGSGYCRKSHNLLTGKYIVENDYYDEKSEGMKTERFSDKEKLAPIFINDFSSATLDKLTRVGRKYERLWSD